MRKTYQFLAMIIILPFAMISCQSGNITVANPIRGSYEVEERQPSSEVIYLSGETLYVPIYSSIYHYNDFRTHELSATLSIHNIDLNSSVKVIKADYYNTNGDLLKTFVEKGLILKPLQTVQIVIHENDGAGGTGANFIVEWVSESDVNSPIVEAVMISTSGQQGISFTTTGRVIQTLKEK